jgi:hypothetical protein
MEGIRPHTKKANDEANSGKVVKFTKYKGKTLRMVIQ